MLRLALRRGILRFDATASPIVICLRGQGDGAAGSVAVRIEGAVSPVSTPPPRPTRPTPAKSRSPSQRSSRRVVLQTTQRIAQRMLQVLDRFSFVPVEVAVETRIAWLLYVDVNRRDQARRAFRSCWLWISTLHHGDDVQPQSHSCSVPVVRVHLDRLHREPQVLVYVKPIHFAKVSTQRTGGQSAMCATTGRPCAVG